MEAIHFLIDTFHSLPQFVFDCFVFHSIRTIGKVITIQFLCFYLGQFFQKENSYN